MAYTTINKSTEHFNTTLHTGNGSTQSITGVGFQPDFTWIKRRSADGWHWFTDAVRGTTKTIYSNATTAEETNTDGLTAFGTDGFTVGSNADINGNTQTHVAWNWKANGAGSTNYDGSITSTVSANQTAGFSIVKYTGTGANASIGHGLGSAPKVIIIKGLSTTYDWVYGGDNLSGFGNSSFLTLNTTNAKNTTSAVWNDTLPTSSVFSVGSNLAVNSSSVEHIAYCFAEKSGYSKFGSYTGNGSSDGPFIYTGFKPAWIMTKMSSGVQTWNIFDNRRNGYNPTERNLQANLNNAEDTGRDLDILSNGFKQRNGGAEGNGNSSTYIYMAFAEEPLVANVGQSIPATAR